MDYTVTHFVHMSLNTPQSGNIPLGMKIDGGYISFGGIKVPSLRLLDELRDPQASEEHRKVLRTWINDTTPEEVFKYSRGDYIDCLVHAQYGDHIVNQKTLTYIWSKTTELQEKYPNFEGISSLLESDKLKKTENSFSQEDDSPWISLGAFASQLSFYTQGGENNGFIEHFYNIKQNGTAEHLWSKTRLKKEFVELQKHKTRERVRDVLLKEAGDNPQEISSVLLASRTIAKARYFSKRNK